MNLLRAIAIIFYSALLSGFALAQDEQLEIRGFSLGISEREANAQLDNINRARTTPEKWSAQKKRQTLDCRKETNQVIGDRNCGFATIVVDRFTLVTFRFFEDKLGMAVFELMPRREETLSQTFNDVTGAMKEKYGEPFANSTKPVWRRGEQSITVSREDERVKVLLMSASYASEVLRRKKEIDVRNAKKL